MSCVLAWHKKHIMSQQNIHDRLSSLRNRMRNITHSPQGKEFFTFFVFVLLSAGVWCILAINENRERSVQIPIELVNMPEHTVLLQNMPTHIEARIRDKASVLLSYNLGKEEPIRIDFNHHSNDKDAIVINNNNLAGYIHQQLKATTSIQSFTPDSIRVGYTQGEGKRVPIVISGNIATSLHCTITDSIFATPDSATVYGKSSILKQIDCVYTEEFDLQNISDTVRHDVKIKVIPDTRIIPDQTTVVVPVEEYISKNVTVPIAIGDIPEGYSVMTFPSSIQVSFLVPMSQYAAVTSEHFFVGNEFAALENTNGSNAPIKVETGIKYIRNITLSQDSVEYIINAIAQ